MVWHQTTRNYPDIKHIRCLPEQIKKTGIVLPVPEKRLTLLALLIT